VKHVKEKGPKSLLNPNHSLYTPSRKAISKQRQKDLKLLTFKQNRHTTSKTDYCRENTPQPSAINPTTLILTENSIDQNQVDTNRPWKYSNNQTPSNPQQQNTTRDFRSEITSAMESLNKTL